MVLQNKSLLLKCIKSDSALKQNAQETGENTQETGGNTQETGENTANSHVDARPYIAV
jgi:hypothetical protein